LAALVLQLAISFGHVHGLDVGIPVEPAEALAPVSTHADDNTANIPATDDDDYCAICAVISLVGTGRIADAPAALPVRLTFTLILPPGGGEASVAEPGWLPSRARGPPTA